MATFVYASSQGQRTHSARTNFQDAKVQIRSRPINFHPTVTHVLGLVLSVKKGQRELMMLPQHLTDLLMLPLLAELGRGKLLRPRQVEQETLLQK